MTGKICCAKGIGTEGRPASRWWPIHGPNRNNFIKFFLTIALVLGIGVSQTSDVGAANTSDNPGESLDLLREQIKALEQRLEKDTENRDSTSDAITQLEKRVVEVRRRIKNTQIEQSETKQELESLRSAYEALEKSLDAQREHVSTLVRSLHQSGKTPHIRMLLSEKSPSRVSRALVWYQYVTDARTTLIENVRRDLVRSQELSEQMLVRQQALTDLENKLLTDENELKHKSADKKVLLAKLNDNLSQGQTESERLKDDENRLVELINTIAKARREAQRRSEEIARKAARARAIAKRKNIEEKRRVAEAQLNVEQELERQRVELAAAAKKPPFGKLKGKLPMPVAAKIIGRFGEPKPRSGVLWEGLMLATDAGEEVRAIAAGEIVFSGWYRGFGQLLLIDHGDQYLSLYSHNSEILKNLGDLVTAGETVALVGATGGLAEPGLYFEIRKDSQPRDPLIWCRRTP